MVAVDGGEPVVPCACQLSKWMSLGAALLQHAEDASADPVGVPDGQVAEAQAEISGLILVAAFDPDYLGGKGELVAVEVELDADTVPASQVRVRWSAAPQSAFADV